MPDSHWIGRSVHRVEDARLLTGRGQYVDDISSKDVLHTAFLRSPHAHARIRSIDVTAAAEVDGVVVVCTASDLGVANRPIPMVIPREAGTERTQHPLAADTVRYVGEAVAVVGAVSRYRAEDALDKIVVDYEPQPASVDVAAAAETDAPRVHTDLPSNLVADLHEVVGTPNRIFTDTERSLVLRLTIHRGATQPIETRGVVACPESDELRIWSATQRPHRLAAVVANMLNLAASQVRVVSPDVGGGFGPKGNVYPEEIVVAWLAHTYGRPVKWIEDRSEHFQTTLHERDQIHHVEVAFDADGRVLALRDRFVNDAGAYAPYGLAATGNTVMHLPGPYQIRHLDIEGRSIYTNAVPTGPNRGAGRPQGCFVMERVMDAIARSLGLDPATVRNRNFVQPQQMPYETGLMIGGRPVCYDSGDYPRAFATALGVIDVAQFRVEQAEARRQGRFLGLGVAAYTESTGHGPFEAARARLDEDGTIRVHVGTAAQGQGHETTFAQICADVFGIAPEHIVVDAGDTRGIDRGIGTFSSRSAMLGGSAVRQTSMTLRARILEVAGTVLEVAAADIAVTPHGVSVQGVPDRALTWSTVAQAAIEHGIVLDVTESFEPANSAWAYGAMAIIVEIDPDTGLLDVRRIVFVHDCGTMINPKLVEGQIVGGIVQALGGTLLEQIVYDDGGQLLTGSFMDYLLPTATDVPAVEIVHMESPSPLNPLGAKGAGEGGVMPVAPAVAQAVEDALEPWEVTVNRVPLLPEDIWKLMHNDSDGER